MICPHCSATDTRVVDSRAARNNGWINGPHNEPAWRRRRECPKCKTRFTTYERVKTAAQPPLWKLQEALDMLDTAIRYQRRAFDLLRDVLELVKVNNVKPLDVGN